ncbi:uncharacterized protein LOC129612045 [Condylostylus longicornis]|uniref:uncharacterized protein LOC129612045 n=1 Tax=Condylostylus longicornis TaxID=2530218 RepID=UPI00244E58FB|nr:uncharacterized protein LOC129612045 [Condylostylus longicornis]
MDSKPSLDNDELENLLLECNAIISEYGYLNEDAQRDTEAEDLQNLRNDIESFCENVSLRLNENVSLQVIGNGSLQLSENGSLQLKKNVSQSNENVSPQLNENVPLQSNENVSPQLNENVPLQLNRNVSLQLNENGSLQLNENEDSVICTEGTDSLNVPSSTRDTIKDDDVIFVGISEPLIPIIDLSTPIRASKTMRPSKNYSIKEKSRHKNVLEVKKAKSKYDTGVENIEAQCPICLESAVKNIPTSTICGHIFCNKCIVLALKTNKKCPLCKKRNPQLIKLYGLNTKI